MDNTTGSKRYCHRCGNEIPQGDFCPVCGAKQLSLTKGSSWGNMDREAMRNFRIASAIMILAQISSVPLVFSSFLGGSLVPTTQNSPNLSGFFFIIGIVVLATSLIAVAGMYFYSKSFKELMEKDNRGFSFPHTSALILIFIGVVLGLLYFVLLSTIASFTTSTATSGPPSGFGTMIAILGLMGIFGIIALVCAIGVLIGQWRVGSEYNSDLIHIGVILSIIPVLSVIGSILFFIASSKILNSIAPTEEGPISSV